MCRPDSHVCEMGSSEGKKRFPHSCISVQTVSHASCAESASEKSLAYCHLFFYTRYRGYLVAVMTLISPWSVWSGGCAHRSLFSCVPPCPEWGHLHEVMSQTSGNDKIGPTLIDGAPLLFFFFSSVSLSLSLFFTLFHNVSRERKREQRTENERD